MRDLLDDAFAAPSAAPRDAVASRDATGTAAFTPRDTAAAIADSTGPQQAQSPLAVAKAKAHSRSQDFGPGVATDEIRVGIQYTADDSETRRAFGVGGSGDQRAELEAVIDYVNEHGGIAGRELVPVFHATNENAGTFASQAQAACATFTQDNEILLAMTTAKGQEGLLDCLSSASVPLIIEYHYVFDRLDYERAGGLLYQPESINPSRWRFWIDRLAQRGFLRRADIIGVVRWDAPVNMRIVEHVLEPALIDHGARIAEEVAITPPASVAGVGPSASEIGNAVLRFRTRGVSHVIFVGTQGVVPFFWFPAAESQGYRPRYSLNSHELPQFQQVNAPPAQLRDAAGVGWWPMIDVDWRQDPSSPASSQRLCLDIMRRSGQELLDRRNAALAVRKCEHLLFAKTALDRATELTPAGFQRAVEALRDGYSSAMTFKAIFGPGRHDGGGAARDFAFDAECSCFAYIGELFSVP